MKIKWNHLLEVGGCRHLSIQGFGTQWKTHETERVQQTERSEVRQQLPLQMASNLLQGILRRHTGDPTNLHLNQWGKHGEIYNYEYYENHCLQLQGQRMILHLDRVQYHCSVFIKFNHDLHKNMIYTLNKNSDISHDILVLYNNNENVHGNKMNGSGNDDDVFVLSSIEKMYT